MSKEFKIFIAFLMATAAAALVATVGIIGVRTVFIVPADYFSLFLSFYIPAFWVASMHSLLLGVPAYIILARRNKIRWLSILLGSFIIGALPVTVFCAVINQLNFNASVFFGAIGLCGGIVFYLIWRYWIRLTP